GAFGGHDGPGSESAGSPPRVSPPHAGRSAPGWCGLPRARGTTVPPPRGWRYGSSPRLLWFYAWRSGQLELGSVGVEFTDFAPPAGGVLRRIASALRIAMERMPHAVCSSGSILPDCNIHLRARGACRRRPTRGGDGGTGQG